MNGSGHTGRVLVVDDDAAIRRSLERGLRLSGFAVEVAEDGASALARLAAAPPDVLVLDVSMPGITGTEVCRTLRARGDETPVLMLSALDELADRVAGLQAGADDYLVKPFALEELVLRLHALLRRRPPQPSDRLLVGPLAIEPATRRATRDGVELHLTRREFELLTQLARNPGIVQSRELLLDRVWGYDFDVRSDAVDTFISYLRRKLEAGGRPRLIHTVRGVGFVLRLPDPPQDPLQGQPQDPPQGPRPAPDAGEGSR
ncbi:response regulator transcription factor [Kitasatospora paracochleata]|uniref:Two-component system response regulator PrrA n=1 Tax=Kitasatospora paracochleata TaxID=58354 RepID=A0ABT1ITF5_9ACTN|nr:response regulator transcription factor [Kitasatospora paracochleata]MCP2308417.1 two-component system response regulator PrrA [Kitasatospora paracochleata]